MSSTVSNTLFQAFVPNMRERGVILRFFWIAAVTFHIAWVCGFTDALGFTAPFASKTEVNQFADLLRSSLAESKAKDIREQLRKICVARGEDQDSALREKERLQTEYKKLTGERYPEPPCEQLR